MRRGRVFIYLAFIIVLGLLAFVVVYQRFWKPTAPDTTQQPAPTQVVDLVNVVVMAQRVPRGGQLEANVLSLVPIQRDLFIDGMFTEIGEVEGNLAKFDLDAGIPLTRGMMVTSADQLSGTGSNAALQIPRGMVAVSLPISRLSSVSYAPQSGDHVNVIVSMLLAEIDPDFQTRLPNVAGVAIAPGIQPPEGPEYLTARLEAGTEGGTTVGKAEVIPGLGQTIYSVPSEPQRSRLVSQYLLQDVMVLKMGEFPYEGLPQATPVPEEVEQPVAEEGTDQQAPEVPPPPEVVTLIVTPQDAITLNYLLYYQSYLGAQMTLALRSAEDDTRVQTEAVTLQYLLETYNIPVPAKLPYGIEPRVDTVELPGEKESGAAQPPE